MEEIDKIAVCELVNVLRAEENGFDLVADPQSPIAGVSICAQNDDDEVYEIGWVSDQLLRQDPRAAAMAISRIKFQQK